MIDLIIPYYNNPNGLRRTLSSINTKIFHIVVVDDGSTIGFKDKVNQFIRVNQNGGPGKARQLGLERTNNPYVMFIDTGDKFISKEVQNEIVKVIKNSPNTNVFSFKYYHYDKETNHLDNRLHGKVYKREFLEKYGISFCLKSSYMNEDIGFNMACRIISESINNPIICIDIPIIYQIKDPKSLTEKNNNEALYKKQTRALSLVSIHAIEICNKNNFNTQVEINKIALALYYWFIRTAAERPEFIQEAWVGARIFYSYFYSKIKPNELIIGNSYIKKCLAYKDKIKFPINILRFINDIQKNEIIPDKYLT